MSERAAATSFVIECDAADCYAEWFGWADDEIADVRSAASSNGWGREGELNFCADHWDTETVEATLATRK